MDLINVWIMEFAVTNACRMFVVARNIYRLVSVLCEQKKQRHRKRGSYNKAA